jgi:hypothetical protein
MTLIRHTHPYGFRSGQWAILRCIVPGPDRDCYLVEFADRETDFWVVGDPHAGYEFADPADLYGPIGGAR